VEVLSPRDTLANLQDRVDDYLRFGVRSIWVLDPVRRRGWICAAGSMTEPPDRILAVPGTLIAIQLDELFADLD